MLSEIGSRFRAACFMPEISRELVAGKLTEKGFVYIERAARGLDGCVLSELWFED